MKRGDELLMLNGRSLIGLTHMEAVEMLRTSPRLVQLVVASKVKFNFSSQEGVRRDGGRIGLQWYKGSSVGSPRSLITSSQIKP